MYHKMAVQNIVRGLMNYKVLESVGAPLLSFSIAYAWKQCVSINGADFYAVFSGGSLSGLSSSIVGWVRNEWKFLLHWMSPLRYCWPTLVLFVQQFGWYKIISEKKAILLKWLTWWCSDLHCSLMARTLWVRFWPRARFACSGGFYSGFPSHWKDMHSWPVRNSKLSFGGGVAWTKPSGCNHSVGYVAF